MRVLFLFLSLPLFLCAEIETIKDASQLRIATPALAKRETAKLRLPNGLEALLISDPDTKQSAAALAVQAGSWNDSPEYPGIAHFLEHMLFLGNRAYPEEDGFMRFINDNGGKVNAYTATDRTVYMFSVDNSAFSSALDQFAHFFIDPLFSTGSINRELLAVDQEHAKNVENDGWRQYMIFKETGNPTHPNGKFSTGNAQTLGGIPREAMIEWYENHYSAKKMHLVVISNQPLNELISLTEADFSAVPIRSYPEKQIPEGLTSEKQRGHLIYIKPVKDIKQLSLTWQIPSSLARNQDAHVGELIGYTLERGCKNCLMGYLKKEHLAEKISARQEELNESNALFTIDIDLTERGVHELDQVITYTFEAIARLKQTGIPRYIYDEVVEIDKIQYEFQARQDAFEFVLDNAHKLVDEDLATFPEKTLMPTEYNPEVIRKYINHLTAQDCLYFVLASPTLSGVQPTIAEKWMGAEYAIKPIPEKQLTAWANASVNAQIGLPTRNPFVPKHLTLLGEDTSDATVVPTLIEDSLQGKVYFAKDKQYQLPENTLIFQIKAPEIDGSARGKALTDLYIKAFDDTLFAPLTAAKLAGTKSELCQNKLSLNLSIHGYSDAANLLAKELVSGFKKIRISKEQFSLYKESLLAEYANASKELPVLQSLELLRNIMFSDAPTSAEKYQALQEITYADFKNFTKNLFKKTYVEGLLYGNMEQTEAENLWNGVKIALGKNPFPPQEQHKREILLLPEQEGPFMVVESTEMQGNAAVLVVEEGPYSFATRASQQVLGTVLKNSFFTTLRTIQQTAYIAKAWENEEEHQLLQFFAVQSSTHEPNDLISRFELFIENFVKQFPVALPETRFENVRTTIIRNLEMPLENSSLMAERLFKLAFDYDADFHLIDKRVKALKELTYEEVEQASKSYLSRGNKRRIAVLVEGNLPSEKNFRYEVTTPTALKQQGTFVAWK